MLLFGVQPDKVLFGTDWPISSMESYINFMQDLKIPEKDSKKIMYENSVKLFKLSVAESSLHNGSAFSWLR